MLFTLISFGDLHPEIQPFKNERWKPNWSTFHHCKLCDAWMIALELDHCASPHFIQMTVSLDVGIPMWCGKIHCIYSELINLEDDVDFYLYNFDLAYLKNTLWIYPTKLYTLYNGSASQLQVNGIFLYGLSSIYIDTFSCSFMTHNGFSAESSACLQSFVGMQPAGCSLYKPNCVIIDS